jgi:hypothetical protein
VGRLHEYNDPIIESKMNSLRSVILSIKKQLNMKEIEEVEDMSEEVTNEEVQQEEVNVEETPVEESNTQPESFVGSMLSQIEDESVKGGWVLEKLGGQRCYRGWKIY